MKKLLVFILLATIFSCLPVTGAQSAQSYELSNLSIDKTSYEDSIKYTIEPLESAPSQDWIDVNFDGANTNFQPNVNLKNKGEMRQYWTKSFDTELDMAAVCDNTLILSNRKEDSTEMKFIQATNSNSGSEHEAGELLWSKTDLGYEGCARQAVFDVNSPNLTALDVKTGKQIWKYREYGINVISANSEGVIINTRDGIKSLNPETGEVRFNIREDLILGKIVHGENRIYAVDRSGETSSLVSINDRGEIEWSREISGTVYKSGFLVKSGNYLQLNRGWDYTYINTYRTDGKKVGGLDMEDQTHGDYAIHQDSLYLLTWDSYYYHRDTYDSIARYDIDSKGSFDKTWKTDIPSSISVDSSSNFNGISKIGDRIYLDGKALDEEGNLVWGLDETDLFGIDSTFGDIQRRSFEAPLQYGGVLFYVADGGGESDVIAVTSNKAYTRFQLIESQNRIEDTNVVMSYEAKRFNTAVESFRSAQYVEANSITSEVNQKIIKNEEEANRSKQTIDELESKFNEDVSVPSKYARNFSPRFPSATEDYKKSVKLYNKGLYNESLAYANDGLDKYKSRLKEAQKATNEIDKMYDARSNSDKTQDSIIQEGLNRSSKSIVSGNYTKASNIAKKYLGQLEKARKTKSGIEYSKNIISSERYSNVSSLEKQNKEAINDYRNKDINQAEEKIEKFNSTLSQVSDINSKIEEHKSHSVIHEPIVSVLGKDKYLSSAIDTLNEGKLEESKNYIDKANRLDKIAERIFYTFVIIISSTVLIFVSILYRNHKNKQIKGEIAETLGISQGKIQQDEIESLNNLVNALQTAKDVYPIDICDTTVTFDEWSFSVSRNKISSQKTNLSSVKNIGDMLSDDTVLRVNNREICPEFIINDIRKTECLTDATSIQELEEDVEKYLDFKKKYHDQIDGENMHVRLECEISDTVEPKSHIEKLSNSVAKGELEKVDELVQEGKETAEVLENMQKSMFQYEDLPYESLHIKRSVEQSIQSGETDEIQRLEKQINDVISEYNGIENPNELCTKLEQEIKEAIQRTNADQVREVGIKHKKSQLQDNAEALLESINFKYIDYEYEFMMSQVSRTESIDGLIQVIEKLRRLSEEEWNIKSIVRNMDPYEFESLIADLWDYKGYETQVTQGSGDKGIDVIAKDSNETIAIQAKRYNPDSNKVGSGDLRDVAGAIAQQGMNNGIIVTTSEFSSTALSDKNDINSRHNGLTIKTMDGYELIENLHDSNISPP